MKIKKDDTILITKGKYRGKTGKVLRAFPRQNKVVVEGINIVKKSTKAQKEGEKGKIVEIPSPIFVSNTALICKKCKKPTRIGYKIIEKGKTKEKQKVRICKKCGGQT